MKQTTVDNRLKLVTPDFSRFNLEQCRTALELVTISYTKALSYHHSLDFLYPEGPILPLDADLALEVQLVCEMRCEEMLSAIQELAMRCWRRELEAK